MQAAAAAAAVWRRLAGLVLFVAVAAAAAAVPTPANAAAAAAAPATLRSYVGALLEEAALARGLAGRTQPRGVPDLLDRASDYKGTEVGKVTAEHEYPLTEGYRPVNGYFTQTVPCERLMRMWMENCAFKDFPDSLYWKGGGKLYPTAPRAADGEQLPTSNYIGNVMAQAGPLVQKYHAAGGKKK